MPRIALITQSFPNQKSELAAFSFNLTSTLSGQGHELHVITSAKTDILATSKRMSIYKIMESWSALEASKFVKLFLEIKPEIIHLVFSSQFPIPILFSLLTEMNRHLWKLPFVTTVYDFSPSLLERIKSMAVFSSSHAITAPQEFVKKEITKLLTNGEKVTVVNNGSDLKGIHQKSSKECEFWDLDRNDLVFGFVGRANSHFKFFLQAALPLLKKNGHFKILAMNVLLTPLEREEILKNLESRELLSQVIFTGILEREKLRDSYQACDLLVFLNDRPIEKLLDSNMRDALTSLAPCLSWTESKNYSEFNFENRENIWLVDFMNLNQLRDDLYSLAENVQLRNTFIHKVRLSKPAFSYDAVSNELSRIYAKMATRPFIT